MKKLESILDKYKKNFTEVSEINNSYGDYRNVRFYNRSFSGRSKFNQNIYDKIEKIILDLTPKINYIQQRFNRLGITVSLFTSSYSVLIISNTYRHFGNGGYPHTIKQEDGIFSKKPDKKIDMIKYVCELTLDEDFNIIEDYISFPLEKISESEYQGYGVMGNLFRITEKIEPSSHIYKKYSDPSEGILDIILQHVERIVDITCKEHKY